MGGLAASPKLAGPIGLPAPKIEELTVVESDPPKYRELKA